MESKTLGTCWRSMQQLLSEAGFADARLEARFLLEHVVGCRHADLLVSSDCSVSTEHLNTLNELLYRRMTGEPLAYLFGEAEFRGRVFQVSPAVLIPRPETEVLIDLALEKMRALEAPKVLDLGTGSGIIAISLALECPAALLAALDLSPEALAVAANNAGRLGAKVEFRCSDWLDALDNEQFDLIVSNPPYVADGDPHLAHDGLPFEPQMALTDGADGLACIRRIVSGAPAHLKAGGWLFFEHGYDQGEASRNLLTAAGFKAAATYPDLAGIDRVSGGHL